MIDRVVAELGPQGVRSAGRLQMVRAGAVRRLVCFGGEESAGASFLRRDGTVWTTDKDGLIWACSPPKSRRARAATRASTTRS